MQLAHARDDGFFALCIKMDSECGVLPGETIDAFREFVHVILVIRLKKEGRFSWKTESIFVFFQAVIKSIFYLIGWLNSHGNDRLWYVDGLLFEQKNRKLAERFKTIKQNSFLQFDPPGSLSGSPWRG